MELRAEDPALPYNTGKYWEVETGIDTMGHTVLIHNVNMYVGISVDTSIGYFYSINFILNSMQ